MSLPCPINIKEYNINGFNEKLKLTYDQYKIENILEESAI